MWLPNQLRGYAYGGEVPGEALVEGDHPVNDTVPAKLSPGEVVLSRTEAADRDAIGDLLMAIGQLHKTKR
jgi:hypothetical protein